MKITTLSGHLTATNKKHIKDILELNLSAAKVNTINYCLRLNDGIYTVWVIKKDNSIVIGEKVQKSKATFKIN